MSKVGICHACLSIMIFCGGIVSLAHPHNSSPIADLSNAGVSQIATEQLVPAVPKVGSIPAADPGACILNQTQYTIQYPGGGAKLLLEFQSEYPVRIAVRRNLPVTLEGDQFVADVGPLFITSITPNIILPDRLPLDAATYFIAVINCAPRSVNFTLTGTLIGPPDTDTVDLGFPSSGSLIAHGIPELGSIPVVGPNNCSLGRTQYTVSVADSAFCDWPSRWYVLLRSDQNLNLYARLGQRVAVEDDKVIADFSSKPPSGSGAFSVLSSISATPVVRTYYIAVENCGSIAANYLLTFEDNTPEFPSPGILRVAAAAEGKNLIVTGLYLNPESIVLFNGDPQKTKYGGQVFGDFFYNDILIVKKGLKRIAPGQSVMISVKMQGCTTRPVQYVRPND